MPKADTRSQGHRQGRQGAKGAKVSAAALSEEVEPVALRSLTKSIRSMRSFLRMPLGVLGSLALLAILLGACGDDIGACEVDPAVSNLQGIYRIQENLTNNDGCDAPGTDDDTSEELLIVFAPVGLDPPELRAEPCKNLADCQERCAIQRAEYRFDAGGDPGWSATDVVVIPGEERCFYRFESRTLATAGGELTVSENRHLLYSERRERNEQCEDLPERPVRTEADLQMRECAARDDLRATFESPIDVVLTAE